MQADRLYTEEVLSSWDGGWDLEFVLAVGEWGRPSTCVCGKCGVDDSLLGDLQLCEFGIYEQNNRIHDVKRTLVHFKLVMVAVVALDTLAR